MKKIILVLIAVYWLPCAAAAQWVSAGTVTSVSPAANGMTVTAGDIRATVEALSPTVMHVRYHRPNEIQRESFAVVGLASFHPPAVRVEQSADAAEFTTGAVRVRIAKNPLRISFLTATGEPISGDAAPAEFNGAAFRVWKTMPMDEHYFGLGEKSGPFDRREQAVTMWDTDAYAWRGGSDPLYQSIPFFLGLRRGAAYGIFLDNTYRSTFDFGKLIHDQYSFGAEGGDLNYYFFYGPDPKRVIEDYTALVGRMPLPPLWSLGFQQSRYSYPSEARVREVAAEFRKRRIPCDVIYLDLFYESERRPFTIDREKFPNFEGMVRDLANMGIKTVPIVDLHLKQEVGYKPYDEGVKGDHFVKNPDGSLYVGTVWPGPSVFPDFTRDASRRWWGSLFTDFANMGVRGIWNDMNEPAVFNPPPEPHTMPLDVVHRVETATEHRVTDHREIHNVFGMENARGTYEGLLKLKPGLRPFVLTRAGFAGVWRYAATWTGDNQSTWEHYRLTVPTLLGLGISGYAFVGDDIGGYAGSPTPELLTRWIELGAFTPFYRDHTEINTHDQEPWVHGPEQEAIRRRYIELRYKLLPYIYAGMEEASRTGIPLMRPLFLEFPNGADLATNEAEFLFGRDLLVAPKLRETLDPYTVALPRGGWYDFWTGARVTEDDKPKPAPGAAAANVAPPPPQRVDPALDMVPVYVRAGAIIPQQPVVQSTTETPSGPLTLAVYPGPDCHGSLYLDDGNTFAYQRGEFYRAEFTCEDSAAGSAGSRTLRIRTRVVNSNYQPWWSEVNVLAMGFNAAPQSVTAGGKAITGWNYDASRHAVSITVPASALTGEILIR